MSNMREASKKEWTSDDTREDINAGSFQRIADACELMARNHAALIAERDRYERWHKEEQARRQVLERRLIALRGVVTKLKRRKP